jgi:uncharacterized membrane protein YeiH
MVWQVLNIVGTIAFAISGCVTAMEEKYDVLGMFVLAFVSAFGGGMVRNLIIGLPVAEIWHQPVLFLVATLVIFVLFLLPNKWISSWNKIVQFFDAIGLSAFAIEGALYANAAHSTMTTTVIAALMTGIGGGMIRDVLAGRKPLVLHSEIYALWAMIAGVVIGLNVVSTAWLQYALFISITLMRLVSLRYNWRLPKKHIRHDEGSASGLHHNG